MLLRKRFMKIRSKMMIAAGAFLMIPLSLRGQSPQSLGGVTLTEVAPRVVTPNGDLLNDVIYFKFGGDSLSGLPLESQVYDLHGAKVSNMTASSDETALLWNGKDEAGRTVPSGIYIYSIKLGDRQATGTVVVAR